MATTRPPIAVSQRDRLRGKMETVSQVEGNNMFGGVRFGGARTGGNGDAPPPKYSGHDAPRLGYNMTPPVDYGMDATTGRKY
jgi:hypothetical protein